MSLRDRSWTPGDDLAFQSGKPDLYLVEPGGIGRSEVELDSWVPLQKFIHLILQQLVETALELCGAQSAGISLLEEENGQPIFRWHGVAGEYAPHLWSTTPREFSPCGTVLDMLTRASSSERRLTMN